MNHWIISHPKTVYLGQGEKIKKIRNYKAKLNQQKNF